MKTEIIVSLQIALIIATGYCDPCLESERIFQLSNDITSIDHEFEPEDIDSFMTILSHDCAFINNTAATFAKCISNCIENEHCVAFSYTADGECETCLLTSSGNQTSHLLNTFVDLAIFQSILNGNSLVYIY